ncbi:MAG: GNAT family N-acetyltransferase [Bacteroidota bacterium]
MFKFQIEEGPIPQATYQRMRIISGLSPKSDEACAIGLPNSLYAVMIKEENQVIGMGRVIGDGGCFCQVVDICVIPEKQGQGLGKLIMQQILNFIETKLPPTCYVSLIADGDASYLYEQFGFKDTMPVSKGMFLRRN